MCLVVDDDALDDGFVEHLAVPVLQPLRLWDFHLRRMTVEDVVVTLARRTCPDVRHGITIKQSKLVYRVTCKKGTRMMNSNIVTQAISRNPSIQ